MLEEMDTNERLKLMRFVCSFAWADLEISDAERAFVHRLVGRLSLSRHEKAQVAGWMTMPPRAEEVDPYDIPEQHRQVFLAMARAMMASDGHVTEGEVETYKILEQLVQ
jgi:uncharacterized tellurite resistance protein B-like protein